MKRIIGKPFALLMAFIMTVSIMPGMNALAQAKPDFTADDYVSLPALREEAASGWHQTYTAKGREVVVNADVPWMPQVDTCPIVQVEGWGKQVNPEAVAVYESFRDNRTNIRAHQSDTALVLGIVQRDTIVPAENDSYNGRTVQPQNLTFYDGETPTERPENVDLSYEEFLEKISSDIAPLTELTLDDFRIKLVRVDGVSYKAKEKNGELIQGAAFTKMGHYFLQAQQLLHGIPVVGQSGEGQTPNGLLRYSYANPRWFHFVLACSKELAIHTLDVPLLSFDAIRRVMEQQIEEGKLRGVDEMEFGYLAFYQGEKDNRTWLMMPVWRIKGGYTKDPGKENVMPYHDKRDRDGSLTVPMGYGDYFYCAQTGEMLPTSYLTGSADQLPAREIVTWESIR